MKEKILGTRNLPVWVDVALLLVRLVVGIAFMHHGYGKIQHPFTWMGPQSGYPGFFLALSAISEFVGGAAFVLGFLTRISAFGMVCNMAVAVHLHLFILGDPFINAKGGSSYELALVYLILGVLLLITGPGRYSLDRLIFDKK